MNKITSKSGFLIQSWALVFIFYLISLCLNAQKENIRFKHISIKDGLSQLAVNCIIQDSKGFMWFGTQDGLNRYDGYTFKIYRNNPKKKKTISDNYIWSIYEDKSGVLWIGTNGGGLNKFDKKTEEFSKYMHGSDKTVEPNRLSHNEVRCIHEDKRGMLWIGTKGGLDLFDRKKNIFIHFKYEEGNDKSLSSNNIWCIFEDKSMMLWIGTEGGGLNRLDPKNKRFVRYMSKKDDPESLSSNTIRCIFEDNDGMLWIGTEQGGINKLDQKTGKFIHYKYNKVDTNSLSHNTVKAIYEDKYNTLWIGTEDGLNIFNQKTGEFIRFKNNPAIAYSLSYNNVSNIYEDKSGVLWIGTRGGGLNKLYQLTRNFSLYDHDALNSNSLSDRDIWCIYEDNVGVMWIGTQSGGLNKFDRIKGNFYHYINDPENPKSLSYNHIRAIHEDRYGVLWIATLGGGLNKFNRNTEKFKNFKNNPEVRQSLGHNRLSSILEDRYGNLWIGTEGGGLNKLLDSEKGLFKRYTYKEEGKQVLSDDRVMCILEDHSGILWVGTRSGGLNKYNRETDNFSFYRHDPKVNESLSNNFVMSIYEDHSKVLWIGTYGGGLNKMLDRKKGIFKSYREQDGLPNDVIYGILEDEESNLWMSTNKGISKFDPQAKKFRNYDESNGLQSDEFNAGAYFKRKKNGEMFFGGSEGLNSFLPKNIKDDFYMPPIVITKFLLANIAVDLKSDDPNSQLEKAIDETESLTLTYKQNVFTFEFAALSFSNPLKNKYTYKMDGYDRDWLITDGKNPRATYTSLSPGEYTFLVRSGNKKGEWSKQGASIKLKILPPPWETWWAYTLYILTFLLILGTVILRLLRSKRILKHRVEERTKELNLKTEALEKKHQELKNTQCQLVQSEKMRALGDLVANIAHEINNPTSFIHTTSYNLHRDLDKLKAFLLELAGEDADKEIKDAFSERFSILFNHLNTLEEGTNRIKVTVNALRTFSRMDNDETKLVNLQEGLQATLNLVRTKYKEVVEFITNFQPILEVHGNLAELNQVFMNIIKNACQAIIEKQESTKDNLKGTLTIKTFTQNDEVVIIFQDTGKGIPPEVREKMFEPFFSTRTDGEGTGLGLSISYGIIKKHKGRIEVESEEGKGTNVTIYLPIERKEETISERR